MSDNGAEHNAEARPDIANAQPDGCLVLLRRRQKGTGSVYVKCVKFKIPGVPLCLVPPRAAANVRRDRYWLRYTALRMSSYYGSNPIPTRVPIFGCDIGIKITINFFFVRPVHHYTDSNTMNALILRHPQVPVEEGMINSCYKYLCKVMDGIVYE
jgi:hypothetical protein